MALILLLLGELLRALLHFSVEALSIAGGVILFVLAVGMVLAHPKSSGLPTGRDPMQLAQFPLAVPHLLNPSASSAWSRSRPRRSRSLPSW